MCLPVQDLHPVCASKAGIDVATGLPAVGTWRAWFPDRVANGGVHIKIRCGVNLGPPASGMTDPGEIPSRNRRGLQTQH